MDKSKSISVPKGKATDKRVRRSVTLRDVASESGVSIATASIVLNNSPLSKSLSPQTRAKVNEAAQRLRYSPDLIARSLKRQQSQTIGVMIFDIGDPYCTRLLKGIESSVGRTDFLPLIMSVQNKKDLFERYSKLALERRVEGLIVVPNWATLNREAFNIFAQMPCVMIGGKPQEENISFVTIDNVEGGYRALEYIYSLGHREIAILRGPRHMPDSKERWQGIQKFAREVGLDLSPALLKNIQSVKGATSAFSEGYSLTLELIRESPSFSALIAFDDLSAAGAIRAFHESGWHVPDRCSVIGFDDIPSAELISPTLTTLRQPLEEMGSLAIDMLLSLIERENQGATLQSSRIFAPSLTQRGSTGPVLSRTDTAGS